MLVLSKLQYIENMSSLLELKFKYITMVIIIMIIIEREEDKKRFNTLGDWILVYGRRKTGKTFFIENFTQWDEFFYVRRDRNIFSKKDMKTISYESRGNRKGTSGKNC